VPDENSVSIDQAERYRQIIRDLQLDSTRNIWGRPPTVTPVSLVSSITPRIHDEYEMPIKKTQEFYNRKLIDFLPRLKTYQTDGDIGIEIECEGQNLFNSPLRYWAVHSDGSLRNSPEGHPPLEYVLRKPMSRKEVSEALEYLTLKLRGAKSRVLDSHRTSVHVHFNCQQWTLKEIFTFVSLYLIFENALVEFSGPDRVGNLFCQRAKDSQFWIYSIVRAFQTGTFRDVFSENFRYTSCNTASLHKFGSIEFRSMRGTIDRETIENWIDLLDKIRQKSKTFKDPYDLYEKFYESTPGEFLDFIFKDTPKLKDLLSGTSNLNQGLEQGSIFVRDIAYSIETWKEALPELKKKKKVKQTVEEVPVIEPDGIEGRQSWASRERMAASRGYEFINNSNISRMHPFTTRSGSTSVEVPPSGRVYYDNDGLISLWSRNEDGNYHRQQWLINEARWYT
jgi:hypothetical protein